MQCSFGPLAICLAKFIHDAAAVTAGADAAVSPGPGCAEQLRIADCDQRGIRACSVAAIALAAKTVKRLLRPGVARRQLVDDTVILRPAVGGGAVKRRDAIVNGAPGRAHISKAAWMNSVSSAGEAVDNRQCPGSSVEFHFVDASLAVRSPKSGRAVEVSGFVDDEVPCWSPAIFAVGDRIGTKAVNDVVFPGSFDLLQLVDHAPSGISAAPRGPIQISCSVLHNAAKWSVSVRTFRGRQQAERVKNLKRRSRCGARGRQAECCDSRPYACAAQPATR